MTTTTTNPYPNVPIPAGASAVDEWADVGTPDVFRYFETPHVIIPTAHSGDVHVYTRGLQWPDGSIKREVCVSELHHDHSLTAAEALQIGQATVAVAEAVIGWETT